jgi:hypothetical protein
MNEQYTTDNVIDAAFLFASGFPVRPIGRQGTRTTFGVEIEVAEAERLLETPERHFVTRLMRARRALLQYGDLVASGGGR